MNQIKFAFGRYRIVLSLNTIWLNAVVIFFVTFCCGIQDAYAQIDGGGLVGGGGVTDGGGVFGGTTGGTTGNTGTGGTLGGTANGGGGTDGFGDNIGNVLQGADTTDVRNQGFVGATGTSIQTNGFVGPPGEDSAPPLAGDGGFGGGVNDVSLSGGAGGGAGGGGAAAGGGNRNTNTGFGGTGQQGTVKGFQVSRGSVRANLRPQFTSPQISGSQIVQRFQNRIRLQPNMGSDGGGIQISIDGTTATMVGFAQSAEESNRVERQLRLEPGVYRIENKTQILDQ